MAKARKTADTIAFSSDRSALRSSYSHHANNPKISAAATNGQAKNTGWRVSVMAPTIASTDAPAGTTNHQAAPRISHGEPDSTPPSSAPAARSAMAGYSGST